ncbi:MAG: serine/threonine-protein kinase [Nannocystaceae bacterium]
MARYELDKPTVGYDDVDVSQPQMLAPRTKLGRYDVLELLGQGGMGSVYTAYDPQLDRRVAIKVLRNRYQDRRRTSLGEARLLREAQALAKLTHPNVITVHEVDTQGGRLFMAMEYVDGTPLDQWIQTDRSWKEIVEVFIDAARGLQAAHAVNITHRDFKPANVLIGRDGRVRVLDFGLAKNDGPASSPDDPRTYGDEPLKPLDTKLTRLGRAVGTPDYMAPEQFEGATADPKTDQYSFGVSMYEALYGALPFDERSTDQLSTLEGVPATTAVEPSDTAVPSWVFRVVRTMLQPEPEDRFGSMGEVISALQADPARRRQRIVIAVAGAAVASLAGTAIYLQGAAAAEHVCSGGAERVAQVWSPQHEQRVRAKFLATERPFAGFAADVVEDELARYGERWIELHTEICEATNVRREQSPALMDVRMACLERGRREVRALVEQFEQADEGVVQRAHNAVQDLGDISTCVQAQPDEAVAADPQMAQEIAEIDQMLARAYAMKYTGKEAKALELAERTRARAAELDHAPTQAPIQYLVATLRQSQSSDKSLVRDELLAAIDMAVRAQQPALETLAWTKLMILQAGPLSDPATGLAYRVPAQLAADRAGDEVSSAELRRATGTVRIHAEDYEHALEDLHAALAGFERRYGSGYHGVASLWTNIGAVYGSLGRHAEALDALEQALKIQEKTAGPDHPLLASALTNRASVHQLMKDYGRALEGYERAYSIFERVLPADHERVLRAQVGMANALFELGRLDEARAQLETAIARLRSMPKPNLRLLGIAHDHLAEVYQRQATKAAAAGSSEAVTTLQQLAVQHLQEAIDAHTQRTGPSGSRIYRLQRSLCELQLARAELDAALVACEAAASAQRKADEPDEDALGEILEQLARIHDLRGDPESASAVLRERAEPAAGD